MANWVQDRISLLESFKGITISKWYGTEMALTEGREPDELWYHPSVPWLQMVVAFIETSDGEILQVSDYQVDTSFGIYVSKANKIEPYFSEGYTIFKWEELDCLPTGELTDISYKLDDEELLTEFQFKIAGKNVTFKAGEIYEQNDGSFKLLWKDESIMIQVENEHPKL